MVEPHLVALQLEAAEDGRERLVPPVVAGRVPNVVRRADPACRLELAQPQGRAEVVVDVVPQADGGPVRQGRPQLPQRHDLDAGRTEPFEEVVVPAVAEGALAERGQEAHGANLTGHG